jgi:hypothetical protein
MYCNLYFESVTYLPSSIHVQIGRSALQLASKKGHLEVVKCLLDKGADINDKDEVRYISSISFLFNRFTLCMIKPFNDNYGIDRFCSYIWNMYVTIGCIHGHHLCVNARNHS